MSRSLKRRLAEIDKKKAGKKGPILLFELMKDGESIDPDIEERLAEVKKSNTPYIRIRTNVPMRNDEQRRRSHELKDET